MSWGGIGRYSEYKLINATYECLEQKGIIAMDADLFGRFAGRTGKEKFYLP